jgi:hypothetical protein
MTGQTRHDPNDPATLAVLLEVASGLGAELADLKAFFEDLGEAELTDEQRATMAGAVAALADVLGQLELLSVGSPHLLVVRQTREAIRQCLESGMAPDEVRARFLAIADETLAAADDGPFREIIRQIIDRDASGRPADGGD